MSRIGLIDVDGHRGSKKKFGKTIYPNLALTKIAAWHKSQGDEVVWYEPMLTGHCDKVYMSKIFNFSPDYDNVIDADEIIRGGTGYDIKSCLPKEIDDMQPDLSIYPEVPQDTSYGYLTRGCPNKCPWCVVPRKEGIIHPYWDIDRVANGKKKVVLMDNNILAAGDYAVEQLNKIIEKGYRVDFNQALDARLVTEDYARLLAQVRWLDSRIRFGCDTMQQVKECHRAIDLIDGYGFKGQYFLYTMLNSNIVECYNRIHHWWEISEKCREKHKQKRVYCHAQPYRDPDNPNHMIPQWQKDMAGWVNKKMIFESTDFMDFSPRKGFYCRAYFNKQ